MKRDLLAIDPGYTRSAWVIVSGESRRLILFGITENEDLLAKLVSTDPPLRAVIEQVEGMGMAVGKEVFETVHWAGRFHQALHANGVPVERLPRSAVKLHLCGSRRAKDPNVRQALLDRYGPGRDVAVGTKGKPGPLYGVSKDVWAALAVAVTALDAEGAHA